MSYMNVVQFQIAELVTALHQHPSDREKLCVMLERVLSVLDEAIRQPDWVDKSIPNAGYERGLEVLTHALTDPSLGVTKERTAECLQRARTAMQFLLASTEPRAPFEFKVLPGTPKENGLI